jgi:TetR/AcrR family transcriptional regulator, mexJK operon transcriptional repressor
LLPQRRLPRFLFSVEAGKLVTKPGRIPLNDTIEAPALARPPGLAGRKIEAVTNAARALFLEHGFSATSTDAIAKAAGVSKATLYAYFPSKEALFASLIVAECESLEQALPLPDLSAGLYPALHTFAHQYVRVFIERKDIAFVRTIANESGRFPELGRLFYESGPHATIRRLAGLLDEAKAKGWLEFEDSITAATQFLSLVRGERPLLTVLGIAGDDQSDFDREIESGLQLFLRACRPTENDRAQF